MEKMSYWYAQLISTAVLIALAGCSDDEMGGGQRATGSGIVFGATAGYSTPETRTVYGDYNSDESSQEINWLPGDKVDIYSPESETQQVTYGITNIIDEGNETNQPSTAQLSADAGSTGLTWGADATQDFYAVYPAPSSMSNEAIRNLVKFENGKLTGYIPVNQAHTITEPSGGSTEWMAKPNMDYLYMAAIRKDYTVPTYGSEKQGVSLAFQPLTTTLEITLTGTSESADIPIVQLNVFANNGENIAGYFTCDLTQGTNGQSPDCEYEPSGTTRNMITVSTYYDNGSENVPLQLENGQSITFNVFLLPHQNLSNLSLRVVGLNTSGKEMDLTNVTLQPHMKTRVSVQAPTFTQDGNNWMTVLDDNVFISQLSIPGTANSFSCNYTGWDNSSHLYQTQTADFETQWNSGIRCFELKCPNNENGNSLDGVVLECNNQGLGITFGTAVDQIWEKVQNTGEFAMIIPFFESDGGREGNVTDFANDLNRFFKDHTSYKYVTYGRDKTLGDARGSLMFIARITSEEDDDNIRNAMPAPTQGVFIENWGSLKDNWARRGYTINGNVVDNWARSLTESTMEYYLFDTHDNWSGTNWRPDVYPSRVESNVNFTHSTTREGGSTGSAYIQDWSRVVADNEARTVRLKWGNDDYFYWPASYTEKKNDVYNTFIKAIEDNNNQQGSTFYINSLDGYFIDWDTSNSYQPFIEGRYTGGGCGDIPTFAEQINNDFYNDILNYGENNIYGSMNIVLMDMVYVGNGGRYLPSVIINNNFRFPLLTNGSSSTTNYNASYSNGGNAISNQ